MKYNTLGVITSAKLFYFVQNASTLVVNPRAEDHLSGKPVLRG